MRQTLNPWVGFWTRTRSERGITLYMAAAGMFVLLGFIALAVDMGMLYQVRNDSQNIADAAALAGAREAFVTPNSNKTLAAKEAARSAARANYTPMAASDIRLRDEDIVVVDNATEHTVRVTVRRTAANGNPVRTFFAPIVGFPTVDVTAIATAEAYIPGGAGAPRFGSQCIKPWLLPDINPNTGQPYAVQDIGTDIIIKGGDPQTNVAAPGQFYPLDLEYNGITPSCPSCGDPATNNTGANLYQSNIACCNGNTVVCGDTRLNLQTGNMVGPTQSGVLCLIHQTSLGSGTGQDVLVSVTPLSIQYGSNHPGGGGSYGTSSEALVLVPVYDPATNPITPGQGSYPSVLVNKMIQVFIKRVRNPQGTVDAAIINVITCAGGQPGGSGTVAVGSPIPLRLVRN